MPMVPWPMAGRLSSVLSRLRMRSTWPSRLRPAAARMMASNSPASSFASRVPTLPRRGMISRSGRRVASWHWRRRLEVPTRAPAGSSLSASYLLETKASRGSSRSRMAASTKPDGISAVTSFMECTAMSARPSRMAISSSLMNRPLPPILESARSSTSSPRVVMGTSSTSMPGWAARNWPATCSACHSASGDFRVAIRIFSHMSFPVGTRDGAGVCRGGTGRPPAAGFSSEEKGVSGSADELSHFRYETAAHFQRFVDFPDAHVEMPVRVLLQRADAPRGHQRVAMNAREQAAELLFQRLQRILDQHLAAGMPDGDVFLVGAEIVDVVDIDEAQRVAHARADLPAPLAVALRQRRLLRGVRPAGALQRRFQPFLAHRLHQVIGGLRLEGVDGEAVIGGGEDDRGRRGEARKMARALQPVHARHANVQQHHVGVVLDDLAKRFFAVARFANHFRASDRLQHATQAESRRRLIIHDQYAHHVSLGGSLISASK